jgi:replicative DNA helicase
MKKELIYSQLPPQNLDIERAVIGACLSGSDVFGRVNSIIHSSDCFYAYEHKQIFEAMISLNKEHYPIDILTVSNELNKTGVLDKIGGAYEITKLSNVNTIGHAEMHSMLIMEKYFKREVIRIAGMMISNAYDETVDAFELIDASKLQIDEITKDLSAGEDATVGKVYLEVIKEIETQKVNKSALTGVDTGLYDLNEITNGWQNTDLIIIGGRPSKGKTALGLNLALSAAISTLVDKVPVGIFSLEMSNTQLVKRLASTVTGIDFGKIVSGSITDDEFVKISQKSKYFNSLPIRIADRVYSLPNILNMARTWKEKHDVGLIVIDYLQLIKTTRQSGGNREQEVSGITRELKLLAKELNLPIILLSQLNRGVEQRSSAEPQPADLRESGAIEQDADVIIFPWHGEQDSFISIAKNRNGKTAVKDFALKIKFAGSIQKWMDAKAFEPFTQAYQPENARAGIMNNYQNVRTPYKDEDAPF